MRDLGFVMESFSIVLWIAHPVLVGRPTPMLVWILIICLAPPYWVDDGIKAARAGISFQFFVGALVRVIHLEPVL